MACSGGFPASQGRTTHQACTAADRQTSHNPGHKPHSRDSRSSMPARGHTKRDRRTKDPNRTPSQTPSTAIRSPSPSRANPNHRPNRSHGPNRLSNHYHPDRSPGTRGRFRRRNPTRLLTGQCLTGQRCAKRHRKFRYYERRGLSSLRPRDCVLHWNARNCLHRNARNCCHCRTNATGHR